MTCLLSAFCVFTQDKIIAGTVTNNHAHGVAVPVAVHGMDSGIKASGQNVSFPGVSSNTIFHF